MVEVLLAILRFIGDVIGWVVDFFQWIAIKIALMVFEAIIAVLSLIPVPEWFAGLSTNIGNLSGGVLFFIAPFQFGTGIAWVVGAYVLRFLIRRLPVVG